MAISDKQTFDPFDLWLGCIVDAAAKGDVGLELELSGGRWLVCEEWPSRRAYCEHAANLLTLEKVVALTRPRGTRKRTAKLAGPH